ncbi:SSI family serine proteinase inhibitor [Actinoplanes sp. GCM10030250]|uniref:SSI family serine proteinase inhibitor n=1 Tax=Actinoplanes sp. GCM10030250 TaxID=3273376 RepID=UPI003608D515
MSQKLIGLAVVGAALLSTASPAVAAPRSTFSLSYTGATTVVRLTCDPTGGGHPQPARACASLRRAGADPAKLQAGDSMCILLYKPVTARLKGTWRGKPVKWEKTYGNSCEMNRATGVLFDF